MWVYRYTAYGDAVMWIMRGRAVGDAIMWYDYVQLLEMLIYGYRNVHRWILLI